MGKAASDWQLYSVWIEKNVVKCLTFYVNEVGISCYDFL